MNFFKNHKDKFIKGALVLFLIVMILFPKASFEGASSGLLLWFHNVLPNLLPFIIISNLLIRLNVSKQISEFFYPVLGKLFHVSKNGCYPIIIGFLSGIPIGAKTTADLVTAKNISKNEGQFLITLCNNASPMFIMGYIAITQLKLPYIKYALFLIIYASAIISAFIFRYFALHNKPILAVASLSIYHQNQYEAKTAPKNISLENSHFSFEILDETIMNGFDVITKIGGYIILFSILAHIINEIGPQTNYIKPFIMGMIEITNGISQVCQSDVNNYRKIVLVAVITSFGGLSGMAQTKSVLGESGLSIFSYFIVKLINMIVTFLLTLFYVTLF